MERICSIFSGQTNTYLLSSSNKLGRCLKSANPSIFVCAHTHARVHVHGTRVDVCYLSWRCCVSKSLGKAPGTFLVIAPPNLNFAIPWYSGPFIETCTINIGIYTKTWALFRSILLEIFQQTGDVSVRVIQINLSNVSLDSHTSKYTLFEVNCNARNRDELKCSFYDVVIIRTWCDIKKFSD